MMSNDLASFLITGTLFIANIILLFQIFPSRFDLRISLGILALFTLCELFVEWLTISLRFDYAGLRSLLYFPLLLYLLRGTVFQKLFAFSLELVFTVSISLLVGTVAKYLLGDGTLIYNVSRFAVLLVIYTVYVVIVTKNKRVIYEKLFSYGSSSAWTVYSFVGLFSFGIMTSSLRAITSPLYFVAVLLFILLSFSVLCFAIINTHEKSKQRNEADFARNVISSGQEHYQKLSEMYDTLRILRHDYKYHVNAISELTKCNDIEDVKKYLTEIETQIPEGELHSYCSNSVLNALLNSYAERFAGLDAKFRVNLSMPDTIPIPNYEMCIIFGNLLENAKEACAKIQRGREVELSVKKQGELLAVMVKNSYNGKVIEQDGQPVSEKKDGGFGLRSVRVVAERYGGHILTGWDDKVFSVYVMLKL